MIFHRTEIRVDGAEPDWSAAGDAIWGAYSGVFGLPDNRRILLSTQPASTLTGIREFEILSRETLNATVRPADATPATELLPAGASGGIYVFRRFAVAAAQVEEFVALSAAAWKTFETDSAFTARALGLFEPLAGDDERNMLLVTWYPGFAAWEQSRSPNPSARENFQARRTLTRETSAIAVRSVR